MKKIILLLISFSAFFACTKNADKGITGSSAIIAESIVPAAVITSFNINFISSTEREWRHGADDSFTCQFNADNQRHEARFDDKGHESSHTIICLDAAVPALVLNVFDTNFPNDIVNEWHFINDNTWKAHFMRNGANWEVTINSNGSIVKSEHD